MAGNTYGQLFRLTTFGESHGKAIGGIIDGCPPLIAIDEDFIAREMARRRPGQSAISTARNEDDAVQILSGVFEGKTTGTPIGFIINNKDHHSADYSNIKDTYRPSHADYTYDKKYGVRDYRGGGRSSARETACRVFAGAIAKLILKDLGCTVDAYVSAVGNIKLDKLYTALDLTKTEETIVRCPDADTAAKMITLIEEVRAEGDTVGGVISCVIKGTPVGLGEPVFDKLHADLAKAVMSINATKGFELGSGFAGAAMRGSQHNDVFLANSGHITATNNSGGIQGGISNGEDIYFSVAFKPVATIMQKQDTIDNQGNVAEITAQGRHDPCVVPRAVPIVEAMAALTLVDHLLRYKSIQ
ncbi:MAG: chorismate synthase [Sphingobacteriales bacterium JAD_PAG50586_3]|nr:MAG: chorismate synthase [Sphingobacteriales bacterium JAD_PAG50586_3]